MSTRAWEAAHRAALRAGDLPRAARLRVLARAVVAAAGPDGPGRWVAGPGRTAHRRAGTDCSASGLLLIPGADLTGCRGPGDRRDLAVRATALGDRFDDPDLRAFGTLGHGQALIAMGDTAAGMARLDEVMVSVTGGEVGPITSGIVYCAVILECMQLFDLPRAVGVDGRAQQLVRRAARPRALPGPVPGAPVAAPAGRRRLVGGDRRPRKPPATASPIRRIRRSAWPTTRRPSCTGWSARSTRPRRSTDRPAGTASTDARPGPARAGSRRPTTQAVAGIRRALLEARDAARAPGAARRGRRHPAGRRRPAGARAAADELTAIAAGRRRPGARRDGEPGERGGARGGGRSRGRARRSCAPRRTRWQALHMPYEAARTAVLVGLACAALGDRTAALTSSSTTRRDAFAAAGRGARPRSPGRADRWPATAPMTAARGDCRSLSAREREVLAQVATGKTNREIAADARHQPAHGRPAPREHLRQAGRDQPGRGDRVRLRARPPLSAEPGLADPVGHSPHRPGRREMGRPGDARAVASVRSLSARRRRRRTRRIAMSSRRPPSRRSTRRPPIG